MKGFTMAYAASPRRGFDLFALIGSWFVQLRKDIVTARKVSQTYRELSVLSERELADLGISRADIRSVALQAVTES